MTYLQGSSAYISKIVYLKETETYIELAIRSGELSPVSITSGVSKDDRET